MLLIIFVFSIFKIRQNVPTLYWDGDGDGGCIVVWDREGAQPCRDTVLIAQQQQDLPCLYPPFLCSLDLHCVTLTLTLTL